MLLTLSSTTLALGLGGAVKLGEEEGHGPIELMNDNSL